MNISDLERLEAIESMPYFFGDELPSNDLKWLISQAHKAQRYEKALTKITTRKMDTYLSSSAMNQDFIKTAMEALVDSD